MSTKGLVEKEGGKDPREKNPSTPDGRSGCESLSDAQGGAPIPLFFVSVASKGFSLAVSLLFATLARRFISVAAKGLTETDCWRESNWVGWRGSEGVRRTTRRAPMIGEAPSYAQASAGRQEIVPT